MNLERLLEVLSNGEKRILTQFLKAQTNKEMANTLCLCEKTIKFHLTKIYRKASLLSGAKMSKAPLLVWVGLYTEDDFKKVKHKDLIPEEHYGDPEDKYE